MSAPAKDYLRRGLIAVLSLIAVLVAVSFIPPQRVGGIELRRANILSDLITFDDTSPEPAAATGLFDTEEFQVDMEAVAEAAVVDTLRTPVQTSFEWLVARAETSAAPAASSAPAASATPAARGGDSVAALTYQRPRPDTIMLSPKVVPIEDFRSADSIVGMQAFYDTLLYARRAVRIAVLGDSFIEGDIFTADLRENLQQAYGGGGAGFAPMASPLTGFRRTIKTQSKGWTSYNIMQRKTAPAALRERFFISGWVCQPAAGASTRWENTDFRRRLDSCSVARVTFVSTRDSRIELTLNDTLKREFSVSGDPSVRQIAVEAPHIRSLTFKVLSGVEGFIGYGAVFENSRGVDLDNYSVRSNNGQAMFWTDASVNAQINALAGFDLVVLQYGLNIMQQGVKNYTAYGDQIEKMIEYVHHCFPGAAVLVLGVSDRSVRTDAGFVPMDAVPYMTACQRRAAEARGAAFWPTYEAMRAMGGMERFVTAGWAGKDYTHINYNGGRKVAEALFDAINAGARARYDAVTAETEAKARRERSVVDSLQHRKIGLTLHGGVDFRLPMPAVVEPAETLYITGK